MWHDSPAPWWQRVPRLRHNAKMLKEWSDELRRIQTAEMERAVRASDLDLLHLPSALEVSSYPEGKFSCPTVMTFLDSIIFEFREIFLDRWPPYQQEFYRIQLKNLETASQIVTISDSGKHDLLEICPVDAGRVTTVYPVVSDAFADYGADVDIIAHTGGNPYFLFNSVPDPHKNPFRVIRGFAQADLPKNIRLVMVMPFDGYHEVKFRELAADRGISDRLVITGFLPDAEMIALYQNAVALISPSLMEGFGLPVAQSMKAGVPVITSNRSAQAEIAVGSGGERAGFLVTPESVDEMRDAIEAMWTDSELRRTFGEVGKKLSASFSAEKQARQLLGVYESAVRA